MIGFTIELKGVLREIPTILSKVNSSAFVGIYFKNGKYVGKNNYIDADALLRDNDQRIVLRVVYLYGQKPNENGVNVSHVDYFFLQDDGSNVIISKRVKTGEWIIIYEPEYSYLNVELVDSLGIVRKGTNHFKYNKFDSSDLNKYNVVPSQDNFEFIVLIYSLLRKFSNKGFKRWEEVDDNMDGDTKDSDVLNSITTQTVFDNSVSSLNELESMTGLESIKQEINGLIAFAKVRKLKLQKGIPVTPGTLHLVFTGNPGTGKTTVARLIGKIYKEIGLLDKGHLVEVSRAGLVAEYVGHTDQKTIKVFNSAIGGVLFIDEAYSLVKEGNDFGMESVETLLKLMEDYREKIVVIVAGYTDKMKKFIQSNPGLESRFSTFIHFEDFMPQELIAIFKLMCQQNLHKLTKGAEYKLEMLIEKWYKKGNFQANARDIRTLFEKVVRNQSQRLATMKEPAQEDLMTITDTDIPDNF